MDPLSLTALISYVGAKGAETVLSGRIEEAYQGIAKTLGERLSRGRIPVNHDVLRCTRRAYLMATLGAVQACLIDLRGRGSRPGTAARPTPGEGARTRGAGPWLDDLQQKLHDNLRALQDDQLPESTQVSALASSEDVRTLLDQFAEPDSESALHLRLSGHVVAEFAGDPGLETDEFPPDRRRFVRAVRDGWAVEAGGTPSTVRWADAFTAFFQHEYKENGSFRAAVDGTLLADLPVGGETLNAPELLAAVEEQTRRSEVLATAVQGVEVAIRDALDAQTDEIVGEVQTGVRTVIAEVQAGNENLFAAFREFVQSPQPASPPSPQEETVVDDGRLLGDYLTWVIEAYEDLELPGLPRGRRGSVPIEDVFVTLRGGIGGTFELQQSRARVESIAAEIAAEITEDVATPSERSRRWMRAAAAVRQPLPASLEERDRTALYGRDGDRSISLAEAFQAERRLVVLGDPGSGKTTLAKWIAVQFARAFLEGKESVEVPRHWVEPQASEGEEVVSLGPARLPVFVRIGQFAQRLADHPDERLVTYLGHHLTATYGEPARLADGTPIPPDDLQDLIRRRLDGQGVVVLLDGLDEVNDPDHRRAVVREIDAFLDIALDDPSPDSPPWKVGRNQAMVTSRIVGYTQVPLGTAATTLDIEPMEPEAVDRFCDLWIGALHKAEGSDRASATAQAEADGLKQAIRSLRRRGGQELTATPLMVTILALVYRAGAIAGGAPRFPRARVQLYELAVGALLKLWQDRAEEKKDRVLPADEVLAVLTPLAEHIHATSSVGLIDEGALAQFLRDLLPAAEVEAFVTLVREEVGLLTARGEGLYGFLHLTFQEYLAARALAAAPDRLVERVLARAGVPRWHEPILMALGLASSRLEDAAFERLLRDFIDHPDPLGAVYPRAEALVVQALPDMERVPTGVLDAVLERLLRRYADPEVRDRLPQLREGIERLVGSVAGGTFADHAERFFVEVLRRHRADPSDLGPAAAQLLGRSRFYTRRLVGELSKTLDADDEAWGWPFDAVLRDVASRQPELIPTDRRSLRHALKRDPALRQAIESDPAWLRIAFALYGGADATVPERILELQQKKSALEAESRALNEVDVFGARPENADARLAEITEETNEVDRALREVKDIRTSFDVDRMHRETAATPLLLKMLRAGVSLARREGTPFASEIERVLARPDSAEARDIALALVLASSPFDAHVESLLRALSPHRRAEFGEACRRIVAANRVPAAAAAAVAVNRQGALVSVPGSRSRLALRTLCEMGFEGGEYPNCIQAVRPAGGAGVSDQVVAEGLAEHVAHATLAPVDDRSFSWAVILDTVGRWLGDPARLTKGLALVAATSYARHNTEFPFVSYDPLAIGAGYPGSDPAVDLSQALDAAAALPDSLDFVCGWFLERLAEPLAEAGMLPLAYEIAEARLPKGVGVREPAIERLEWAARQNALGQNGDAVGAPAPRPAPSPYASICAALRLIAESPLALVLFWDEKQPVTIDLAEAPTQARLLRAAGQIESALRRADAHLRLLDLVTEDRVDACVAEAARAARAIEAPIQRALALGRLAAHPATPAPLPHWTSAIEGLSEIDGSEIPVLLRAFADAVETSHLDAAARVTVEAHLRDHIARLDGFELELALGRSLAAIAPLCKNWSEVHENVLALTAGLRDAERTRARIDAEARAAGPQIPAADEVLDALMRDVHSTPARLSAAVALSLDRALRDGDAETVEAALALVAEPEPAALPILRSWREEGPPRIQEHARLLLAEAGELTPDTLGAIFGWFEDEHADAMRFRAALLLGGGARQKAQWQTSQIGAGVLAEVATRRAEFALQEDPGRANVTSWFFERVVHDEPAVVQHFIDRVGALDISEDRLRDQPDAGVLRSIQTIDSTAWGPFRDGLNEGPWPVQASLFRAVPNLAHRNRLSEAQWADVLAALPRLEGDWLDRASPIVDSFRHAVASLDAMEGRWSLPPDEFSEVADDRFLSGLPTWREVLAGPPEGLPQALQDLGSTNYVGNHWKRRVVFAARGLEERPAAFLALLRWLQGRAARAARGEPGVDVVEYNNGPYHGLALVELAAAGAERMPDTFYSATVGDDDLHEYLCQVARYADSFPARMAAFSLLSFQKRITPGVVEALRASLLDNPLVQGTALDSLSRYTHFSDDDQRETLGDMFEALRSESPAAASMAATLLERLALNPSLPTPVLQDILSQLTRSLKSSEADRPVFRLWRSSEFSLDTRMSCSGLLKDELYLSVSNLSGLVI